MAPNADTPPITPTNTASVETGAWLWMISGRSRLSDSVTPTPQVARKIAQPQEPAGQG